jgi:flagellar protein FlbD
MIKVHKINGEEIVINAELIETVEAVPDTILNLYSGHRYVVKESVDQIKDMVIEYKKYITSPSFKSSDKT